MPQSDINAPKHTEILDAKHDDLANIVKTFGRAFHDDPVIHWIIKPGSDYQTRIEGFYKVLTFRFAWNKARIIRTENTKGAALWYPPGTTNIPFWQQLAAGPDLVKVTGLSRCVKRLAKLQDIQTNHPKLNHYYLQVIGVDPTYQGRGYSSALMNPILSICDKDRVGAYLESSKEENIPIYERFGFKVTKELKLTRHGPSVWLMWREPQAL